MTRTNVKRIKWAGTKDSLRTIIFHNVQDNLFFKVLLRFCGANSGFGISKFRGFFKVLLHFRGSIRDSVFLAALQPYKSSCPPLKQKESQNFKSILSLVIKTKDVQNVNRMSEMQKDRPTDSLTDRQTDRQTERQIEDKTTFQLSYQNKTCSEC